MKTTTLFIASSAIKIMLQPNLYHIHRKEQLELLILRNCAVTLCFSLLVINSLEVSSFLNGISLLLHTFIIGTDLLHGDDTLYVGIDPHAEITRTFTYTEMVREP